MRGSANAVRAVMILGASAGACTPSPTESDLGTAAQAMCAGPYLANVSVRAGSIYVVAPEDLLDSAEAWGPQTLLLSVDRHFGTQVFFQNQPSIEIQKNQITKVLQTVTGLTLSNDVDLTASSSTQVPAGAYERLEAYPEFQVITWDLRSDACGDSPDVLVTSGAVYRPMGVYFRIVSECDDPTSASGAAPGTATSLGPPPALGAATAPTAPNQGDATTGSTHH